jgi:hypothetical protein
VSAVGWLFPFATEGHQKQQQKKQKKRPSPAERGSPLGPRPLLASARLAARRWRAMVEAVLLATPGQGKHQRPLLEA